MKKKILNIFFLLNIFNFIYSTFRFSEIVENYTFGDFSDPEEKDLGQCTCNLTAMCDYNCPCDDACNSEDKAKFNTKEIDVTKYNKDRMEDYKCKSLEEMFDYNKNKAGINVKDHIFNLMCVHFDRSGDLGEFYKTEPKDKDTKAKNWVNQFFEIENNIDANQKEIYKPDSNGYCIKSKVSENKNNEYSCIDTGIDPTQLISGSDNRFGNGNQYTSVKIKINDNGNSMDVLKTNFNSNIINFKILSGDGNGNQNGRRVGYIQGSPIKISLNGILYDQYYFPIINNKGQCSSINDNNIDDFTMKTILFKNNVIYSCIIGNNVIESTQIYDLFCNNSIIICHTPNDCNSQQIQCPNITDINNYKGIDIQLDIYTSKEGKEYNPHEVINNSTININENNNGILTFKVKFTDISYSSYINTKEGKITSLIPLPDNLIKSNILTKRDN